MSALATRARSCLLAIHGVVESGGTFSDGDAFWVNGREIAHFHGDADIELRLTRAVISEQRGRLKADPRVELRRGSSDWITIHPANVSDLALLRELAELAAAAHRADLGTMAAPPPVGAALERRRRFH
jgi:hypothetical protein